LGLAAQDLGRGHARRPQRYRVEIHLHAAIAGAGQLAGRTRQTGPTQVLDADHQPRGVQLQAAFDQHLLGERITHLDAG
jgi:hypothetical protein